MLAFITLIISYLTSFAYAAPVPSSGGIFTDISNVLSEATTDIENLIPQIESAVTSSDPLTELENVVKQMEGDFVSIAFEVGTDIETELGLVIAGIKSADSTLGPIGTELNKLLDAIQNGTASTVTALEGIGASGVDGINVILNIINYSVTYFKSLASEIQNLL